jgi:hypothetical protein
LVREALVKSEISQLLTKERLGPGGIGKDGEFRDLLMGGLWQREALVNSEISRIVPFWAFQAARTPGTDKLKLELQTACASNWINALWLTFRAISSQLFFPASESAD